MKCLVEAGVTTVLCTHTESCHCKYRFERQLCPLTGPPRVSFQWQLRGRDIRKKSRFPANGSAVLTYCAIYLMTALAKLHSGAKKNWSWQVPVGPVLAITDWTSRSQEAVVSARNECPVRPGSTQYSGQTFTAPKSGDQNDKIKNIEYDRCL